MGEADIRDHPVVVLLTWIATIAVLILVFALIATTP